jgi:hypothetical protein
MRLNLYIPLFFMLFHVPSVIGVRASGGFILPMDQYIGYNINITVNEPPQSLSVELDTGYQFLVLPAKTSFFCGHGRRFPCYDPNNSRTAKAVTCADLPAYMCTHCPMPSSECIPAPGFRLADGGEWKYMSDIVRLRDDLQIRIVFLLWTMLGEDASISFGGDLGMMWPSLGLPHVLPSKTSLLASLPSSSAFGQTRVFATCLNKGRGAVEFGGPLKQYQSGPVLSLPLIPNSPHGNYNVTLQQIKVDGTVLLKSLTNGIRYFCGPDTGTWATVVPSFLLDKLHQHLLSEYCEKGVILKGVCGSLDEESLFNLSCVAMSPKDIAMFPTLHFTLVGNNGDGIVHLEMLPQQYLSDDPVLTVPLNRTNCGLRGKYGLALNGIPAMGNNLVVLGSTFLKRYVTVWDFQKEQLGWSVAAGCP